MSVPAFSASDLCGLCVSAFSPLSSSCSGGSSDPFPRAFASAPSCCHPERSKGSAFFGHLASPRNTRKSICHCSQAAIPFRITFFAHPHHLTSIDSHSCKTQGRGLSSTTRPKPFPFFPQRVDMHRTGTAITPVILCVYFTFSGYPGGGVRRNAPLPLLTTHYSLLTGLPQNFYPPASDLRHNPAAQGHTSVPLNQRAHSIRHTGRIQ